MPSATVTPTPTASEVATGIATATSSVTTTATGTETEGPTITATAVNSPTPSTGATERVSATATSTVTVTASASPTHTSSATATLAPTGTATSASSTGSDCGNDLTEPWDEQCDDGGRANGDGCSADCVLEPGGDVCAGIPQHNGGQLRLERVVAGLNRPVSLRAAPGDVDRLFVVEQRGRIRIIKRGVLLATPFLDLTHKVTFGTELGLLSIAFHPDYADNGLFYVYYLDTPAEIGLRSLVSRFQVSADPDRADVASEQIVLEQRQPWNVHKGGDLFFGADRYLYVPFGDGGLSISQQDNGQRLDTWLGKILRLDVDGGDPYRIPPDNPFINVAGARPEIWAMGLRNPWRVSLDHVTGHMFIGDVGEQRWEEIDVSPAGASGLNFGWSRVEGTNCTRVPCNPAQFAAPLVQYPHADGACSIIGGFVYRGCSMPDLHGAYFHSDFCAGFVRSIVYDNGAATDLRDWTAMLQPGERVLNAISSFGQDARGELYICDLDGEVYRLVSADD